MLLSRFFEDLTADYGYKSSKCENNTLKNV